MPRPPATFRQDDVTRALRGAARAGCVVRRAEIDRDGKIILEMIGSEAGPNDPEPPRRPDIVL